MICTGIKIVERRRELETLREGFHCSGWEGFTIPVQLRVRLNLHILKKETAAKGRNEATFRHPDMSEKLVWVNNKGWGVGRFMKLILELVLNEL